jgi:hypothetical protein
VRVKRQVIWKQRCNSPRLKCSQFDQRFMCNTGNCYVLFLFSHMYFLVRLEQ